MFAGYEYFNFGLEGFQDNPYNDSNSGLEGFQDNPFYDFDSMEAETLYDLNSFSMNNVNHKDEDTRNLENSVQNVETSTSLEKDNTNQEDKNNKNDEDVKQSENVILHEKSNNTITHQSNSIIRTEGSVSKNRIADRVTMQKTIELMNEYYSVFIEKKKKFDKIYVKRIDPYLVKYLGLKEMTREEYRCISLYFENRANKKHEIIKCLQDHKNEIMSSNVFDDFKYSDYLRKI